MKIFSFILIQTSAKSVSQFPFKNRREVIIWTIGGLFAGEYMRRPAVVR